MADLILVRASVRRWRGGLPWEPGQTRALAAELSPLFVGDPGFTVEIIDQGSEAEAEAEEAEPNGEAQPAKPKRK